MSGLPIDPAVQAVRFALCDAMIAACNAEKVELARSIRPGARPRRGELKLLADKVTLTPVMKRRVEVAMATLMGGR